MNKTLLAVSGVGALAGIVLVLKSPDMGLAAAGAWLSRAGGSASTSQFEVMMDAYVDAYRLLGGILLSGGILGVLQHLRGASG